MTKNPPNPSGPTDPAGDPSRDALEAFGFDDPNDRWLKSVSLAEHTARLSELGRYQLLAEVGRGGQGIVYRAWDHDNRREVALKRLREGRFATPSARRRLATEISILGRLEHAGIVRAFGMEEVDGTALLVMEWIDGAPITEWARGRGLEEKLGAIARVCDAVQHAHRLGVLHCDLKPSNILMDGSGHPKVLDFGLARVARLEGESPLDSGVHATPAYAAPEQLATDAPPLDVRADVYAVGVILYELLAGTSPYGPTRDLDDLVRAVAEREVGPPSLARPELDAELDSIVGRALAKQRDARYSTMDDLRRDLAAYAANRPVAAHPQSAWYLARKFSSRNRGKVAAAGVVAIALVAFGVHLDATARKLEDERNAAILARTEEETARTIAEAVRDFALEELLPALDPQHPYHASTLEELLDGAADRIHDRFGEIPLAEAAVLQTLGELCRASGRLREAERTLVRAREFTTGLEGADEIRAMTSLGLGRLYGATGNPDPAVRMLDEAVAYFGAPERDDPTMHAIALNDLGVACEQNGEYPRAESLYRRALSIQEANLGRRRVHTARTMQNLGAVLVRLDQLDSADALFEEAVSIQSEEVGADSPFVAELLTCRAEIAKRRGHFAVAEAWFESALVIQRAQLPPTHPVTARTLREYADLLMRTSRFDEGVEVFRERHAMMTSLLGVTSLAAIQATQELVTAMLHTAAAKKHGGESAAAARLAREALAIASVNLAVGNPVRVEAEAAVAADDG
jgi:eukaryotic-like serine/threonine-protein kinase